MVSATRLATFATLATAALAKCKRKAEITTFEATNCTSPAYPAVQHHLKEDHCHDYGNFRSFQVTGRKHSSHYENAWNDASCHLVLFDKKDCRGAQLPTELLPQNFGKCQDSSFGPSGPGQHPVRSVKLVCAKPQPQVSHVTNTVTAPGRTVGIPVGVPVNTLPAGTVTVAAPGSSTASSVQPSVATLKTVTIFAASPTKSAATSSVHTATVKKTTTIIAPPTATIEGTTTIWVAPTTSSSHSIRTNTYVVTVTDAAMVARAVQDAEESEAASTETPVMVIRRNADSTECYASVEGHWIVSTCVAPTPSPSAQ